METKRQKIFIGAICNCLIVVSLAVIFVSAFLIRSKENTISTANSEYHGTIYAGDKNSNNISLMINVYWGTEYVEKMLDVLKKHNVKTTFFIGGTWAKENTVVLKKIYDEGHEIASHGYSHKEHGKLDYTNNLSEIQKCHEIVEELIGVKMELFAPPGGSYNENTTKAASFLGYKTIMWTRDTIDWRDHNTSLIFNRAVTNMCSGDLILMHPTANTLEALSNIIEYAKNHKFNVCKVSETLGLA